MQISGICLIALPGLMLNSFTSTDEPLRSKIGRTLVGYVCMGTDVWSPERPVKQADCVYREKEFSNVHFKSASIIFEKRTVNVEAYVCEGYITYEYYKCESLVKEVGEGFTMVFLTIPVGTKYMKRPFLLNKVSYKIKISPEECETIHEQGEYTVRHDRINVKKKNKIKVKRSKAAEYIGVKGSIKGDICEDAIRMQVNETTYGIIIKAQVVIEYEVKELEAYKVTDGYRIKYKGKSHKASEKGLETLDHSIKYSMKNLGPDAVYKQKTYENVQVVQIGKDKHRHLNIGENRFLELTYNSKRNKEIELSDGESQEVNGTTIKGLYICFDCAEKISTLGKLLPDDKAMDVEIRMKYGETGIRLKKIANNFIIVENRLCKLENIIEMMREQFPEYREDSAGTVFKKENGILYRKKCQSVKVRVLNAKSYCTKEIPILYDSNSYYLQARTQILIKESEERDCDIKEYRNRVIDYETNSSIDLCNGPNFSECEYSPNENTERLKLDEIDNYHAGSLFDDDEHEEYYNTTHEGFEDAEDDYDYEADIEVITNNVSDDEENDYYESDYRPWNFFNFPWMIQSIISWIFDHIKNTLYKIPIIGKLFEFLLKYDDQERTKIVLLGISVVDAVYNCIKTRSLSIVHLILGVVYYFCPSLFLYVKLLEVSHVKVQ